MNPREERDAWAWRVLRPLLDGRPYLPWTEGALRPAALVAVLNEIAFADRLAIVELGSGISTIVMGRLLAERGGSLVAVEHDSDWAAWVRSQLEREGLNQVEVLRAELEPHPDAWADAPWYSRSAIEALPEEIDLLVVDGPPGYGDGMEHSRYPAMPALAHRLTPSAIVILDDADREAEREIAERWSGEVEGWTFGIDADTGIARGVRA